MSRDIGFSSLLIAAAGLYALAFLVLPVVARRPVAAPVFEPAVPSDAFDALPEPDPARLDPFPAQSDIGPRQSQTSPA